MSKKYKRKRYQKIVSLFHCLIVILKTTIQQFDNLTMNKNIKTFIYN